MTNNYIQKSFFEKWKKSSTIRDNITHIKNIENSDGEFFDFPSYLHDDLVTSMQLNGMTKLFSHQLIAIDLIQSGKNVAVTSGPASGKSLIYLIPILNKIFFEQNTTSFLLFPTKALAYDQYQHIKKFFEDSSLKYNSKKECLRKFNVYDGDTPSEIRSKIRKKSQVILTNPDMLHFGILPNHDLWEEFISELKYIILDEAHVYTGIFGSHVANVLRRLKRIISLYNRTPQYICTTATIGNPKNFLSRLSGEEIVLVDQDGSPKGNKELIFYNPPIVNQELGIRKNIHQETLQIVEEFTANNIQTLIFQGTRKEVEKSVKFFQEKQNQPNKINASSYRSGYLALDRRKIEEDFRNGNINALFTTNALELGVDIGKLECVILSGYPGSISSTWQQIGRSGRTKKRAIAVFIASSNPIDQFIIKRPEYLLIKNPENALINPDNPKILVDHLIKTISEMSFFEGENFGDLDWSQIKPLMSLLSEAGIIYKQNNKYSILLNDKSKATCSIRNINSNTMALCTNADGRENIIGEIDYSSCFWMVHPNAVYLHLGEQYLVRDLDLQNDKVYLQKSNVSYYTEPKIKTSYEILSQNSHEPLNSINKYFGQILVTRQVVGYKEILWETNQKIGEQLLDLPETKLETEAFWFGIPEKIKKQLIEDNLWINVKNDYGPGWKKYKDLIRKRDNYTCQKCSIKEENEAHHIHHIKPLKLFESIEHANHPTNLITLCPRCHRLAETQVRVRSGLTGLAYLLKTLSPLFVMSSPQDIDVIIDTKKKITGFDDAILVYDNIPFGLGLSKEIFRIFPTIFQEMLIHVNGCGCHNGCPSCVGPISDEGYGGKEETKHLLKLLVKEINGS